MIIVNTYIPYGTLTLRNSVNWLNAIGIDKKLDMTNAYAVEK